MKKINFKILGIIIFFLLITGAVIVVFQKTVINQKIDADVSIQEIYNGLSQNQKAALLCLEIQDERFWQLINFECENRGRIPRCQLGENKFPKDIAEDDRLVSRILYNSLGRMELTMPECDEVYDIIDKDFIKDYTKIDEYLDYYNNI